MSKETSLFRGLLVFGLCVPLALFLGYQLATPLQRTSLFWIGLALCLLLLPLLLRWHHPLVIFTWNIGLAAFFIPGKPQLGYLLAAVSLFFSIVKRALRGERTFVGSPSVGLPLIFLAGVVVFTAYETGGIHANAFGSDVWGAGRYVGVVGGILGYFALVGQSTPPHRAKLFASLFFLSGAMSIVPVLVALAGPGFQFFHLFFPTPGILTGGFGEVGSFMERFIGMSFFSQSVCCFMMIRYGIRGIFDWHRPWRLAVFAIVFAVGLLGGFRSFVIQMGILCLVQFYFEGLFRSGIILVFVASGILGCTLLMTFADRLPLAVQRSISFLPVKISPVARQDALGSLRWRLEMWQAALPTVPDYLLVGKGYNFDGEDYYLTREAALRGYASSYEFAIISSDFHNGILTLIIPLGIFGVLAFLAFCWGAGRALYANYRYGDPELMRVNTFLFSFFVAHFIFYMVFYGEFYRDLGVFTTVVGLSLSLNEGVRKKAAMTTPSERANLPGNMQLQPA